MKKNRKNGFIGLVALVFFASLVFLNAGGSGSGDQRSDDKSRMMDIPYYPQKNGYYCGQASAQMVLVKIQGKYVSQFRLDPEMGFMPGRGTKVENMRNAFDNRDVGPARAARNLRLKDLRNSVDASQFAIILIRFDEASNSGHFVVISGYNASGFFVHDPWPEEYGEPEGREAGEDAFIGNEVLSDLWLFSRNWALIIGAPVASFNELVELEGEMS